MMNLDKIREAVKIADDVNLVTTGKGANPVKDGEDLKKICESVELLIGENVTLVKVQVAYNYVMALGEAAHNTATGLDTDITTLKAMGKGAVMMIKEREEMRAKVLNDRDIYWNMKDILRVWNDLYDKIDAV